MSTETEAKFIVRDILAFHSLQGLTSLGEFNVKAAGRQEVRDTYLDTRDRMYLQAGYACRLRELEGSEYFIGLKSLVRGKSDVYVRVECEERIDNPTIAVHPELWPMGPTRELATRIGRGVLLGALCELRQTRWKRRIARGKDPMARPLFELSLDEVRLPGLLYCVEVELLEDGTLEELTRITRLLRKAAPLEADEMSKLEHALKAAGIPFPKTAS
jgi:inorganic triphosphatase YgiF